jgi:hypothetical protein
VSNKNPTPEIHLPLVVIEQLFPSLGEEGTEVHPSRAAYDQAAAHLGVPWKQIRWIAPDVFEIRYGSNWVATALSADGRRVRFHVSDSGNWREGDDEGFDTV